jgi:RsiW-degrading membrane proteinase PrsW (M82 family)
METIILIAFIALISYIGYVMAENRGRRPVLWAVITFFFGIFAIIALAIMGDSKEASR